MIAHNPQDGKRSRPSRPDRRRIIELIALMILAATVLALVIIGKAGEALVSACGVFIVAGFVAFRGGKNSQ